jgi:hypothetical protein
MGLNPCSGNGRHLALRTDPDEIPHAEHRARQDHEEQAGDNAGSEQPCQPALWHWIGLGRFFCQIALERGAPLVRQTEDVHAL